MAFQVRIPSLGESVTEGTIVRWAKQDGETIAVDDVLLELETDKASMEIPSEQAGVLKIVKAAGSTVQVGEVVAEIDAGGAPRAAAAPSAAPASAAPSAPASATVAPKSAVPPPSASTPSAPATSAPAA